MIGEIRLSKQERRVLEVLENANEEWVNGRYFLHTMMLSQYHARIWGLQQKGIKVEASKFVDSWGFKSYRLLPKGEKNQQESQETLFT